MRRFAPLLLLAALAGCGSRTGPSDPTTGANAVEDSTLAKVVLTSEAFREGQPIPTQYTCDGADQSPPLSWGEPPPGTKSFALVFDDPDAPSGTFRHWGAFDIPVSTRALAEGQQAGTQAVNDMNKPGYGGPCPPNGHGIHHYHFKLFALNTDALGLGPGAKVADVETAANEHAIGKAELIGTYERK